MRILIVSPRAPWPPIDGGLTRTYRLAQALSARAEVSLLALCLDADAPASPPRAEAPFASYEVAHHPRPKLHKLPILAATYLASRAPFAPLQFRVGGFVQRIGAMVERGGFDVIQIETALAGANVPQCLFASSRRPLVVLDAMDVEAQRLRRQAGLDIGSVARLFYRAEARRMAAWEARLLLRCDGALAVSEEDAAALRGMAAGLRCVVAPNGVDTAKYRPEATPRVADRLLYVGSMDYLPNSDAVRWFAADILPAISRQAPSARLQVVGRGGLNLTDLAASAPVDLCGVADDLQPDYASCGVFVVPLRAGGGTRLKILEALACACPVVSTSIGAEGIPVRHGEHLLIADSAEDFAAAVGSLIADPARARQLGERGSELVRGRFGWDRVAEGVLAFYEQLLEKP